MAKKKTKSKASDDRELENAFQQLTGKNPSSPPQKKQGNGVVAVLCIGLATIILCAGALLFYLVHKDMNKVILGNISIAGVQVQGMTQAEAFSAIEKAYKPKAIEVIVLDHSLEVPADCILDLRTRKAVRAAYELGNTEREHDLNLMPYLKFDQDRIRSILAQLGKFYNTTKQEATYQILGQEPQQILQVTLGTPEYGLDLEQLYQELLLAIGNGATTFEGNCTVLPPTPIDLTAIYTKHCRPATNAKYNINSHQIEGGDEGFAFDLTAAVELLSKAEYGSTVEVPFLVTKPDVTREDVTATLFQDTLGTFTAKASSQSNRDTNLRLACKAIDGIVLYPGDTFSYNKTLGERTPEKGYRPAGTYVGNETVNTYGGGICQVSSSLYYCILLAELTVTERTNHGFLPSYMPRGLDATVSWGALDFQFKNNTDYPVRIAATAKGGSTTVTLYGTETRNYRVKLGAKIVSKTPYETEYKIMEANNKEGYKDGDRIVSPHSGYYVESYIYKYELDSDKLISKEYIDDSTYRVRNAVICKIETPTDDTIPEETTPETPPSSTTPEINTPEETP